MSMPNAHLFIVVLSSDNIKTTLFKVLLDVFARLVDRYEVQISLQLHFVIGLDDKALASILEKYCGHVITDADQHVLCRFICVVYNDNMIQMTEKTHQLSSNFCFSCIVKCSVLVFVFVILNV